MLPTCGRVTGGQSSSSDFMVKEANQLQQREQPFHPNDLQMQV